MSMTVKPKEFGKGTVCPEPSVTRQSEAADADINVIMKRVEKQGVLPLNDQAMVFMDVSELPDFRAVQDRLAEGRELFYRLPAATREAFANDVATFLDEASDPAFRPKLEELGLVAPVEAPPVVEAAPPADGTVSK